MKTKTGEDAPDVRYEWVEVQEGSGDEMEIDEASDESKVADARDEGEELEEDSNLTDTSSVDSDWTDSLSLELDDPANPDTEEEPFGQLDLGPGYEGWSHFQGRSGPISAFPLLNLTFVLVLLECFLRLKRSAQTTILSYQIDLS